MTGVQTCALPISPLFLKITNDIAIAVDQLGTRKGAIAVYLEPWHMDIMDFIDLKKNSGEERRRAHDLFPALWISDLFMERVLEDSHWTLFDPVEVKDLSEYFGEEFTAKYIAYENSDSVTKNRIKAKDLWKKIDRKSTRLNSSHRSLSRMPSSA